MIQTGPTAPAGPIRQLMGLIFCAACLVGPASSAAAGSELYYEIGGGGPVSASAGRGYHPGLLALGINWGTVSACSNLDPFLTVQNQLNGVTQGFQQMMGFVIQSATAAVASLPAIIIQHAAPGLYDLLSNGILQGRVDFNKAKLSCRAMVKRISDAISAAGWFEQAQAENWRRTAASSGDAVAAQQVVESQGGDEGVVWIGGNRRGGLSQPPIQITRDTAIAGYNTLHARTSPTSTTPVPGGGAGWGSVPTATGPWAGAGSGGAGTGCDGGMCTVWGSPAAAANWIVNVLGERVIRTCTGCEKIETTAGTGLIRQLEQEQQQIQTQLAAMVNGSLPVTSTNLRAVSAGPTMAVSGAVIIALGKDPQGPLLTHRLAAEMALARTLTQALWARRVLLAGASEPGIANSENGQVVVQRKLTHLDRGIEGLRTELWIRKAMAANTASIVLARQRGRELASAPTDTRPGDRTIDSRKHVQ